MGVSIKRKSTIVRLKNEPLPYIKPPRTDYFVFLGLWLIPLLVFIMLSNPNNLFLQIYLFFTQAAFATFGGAYAVLAYVSQSAIDSYGWLTHGQMMDGFALAEPSPGPLIMVLQFVGFMAGWGTMLGTSAKSTAPSWLRW